MRPSQCSSGFRGLSALWAILIWFVLPSNDLPAQPAFFTTFHSFNFAPVGANPDSPLTLGSDGNLYGTAPEGGSGYGTVFRVTTNGALSLLHSFTNGVDGSKPEAGLVQASDGYLYGTTYEGGSNNLGSIFKISAGGTFSSIYSFTGSLDGYGPMTGLIQGVDGYLYGNTSMGSQSGWGAIFKATTSGLLLSTYPLTNSDDEDIYPQATLIQGSNGHLYDTTRIGGHFKLGTVFDMTTNGFMTTLDEFDGGTNDGVNPQAGLVLGADGSLYGTTYGGGPGEGGTIFRIATNGAFNLLHSFFYGGGLYPQGSLTLASDGNLYGTTIFGGSNSDNGGTIFRCSTNGDFESLYSFPEGAYGEFPMDNGVAGEFPLTSPTEAGTNILIGTTSSGGTNAFGTVYSISFNAAFSNLNTFPGLNDGIGPDSPLTLAFDGSLYGITRSGGIYGFGAAFRLATNGAFSVLHSFSPTEGGSVGLIQGSDGNFYGTGSAVFKMTTNGSVSILHVFTGQSDGDFVQAPLVQGADGSLYGTAVSGGTNNLGTVYKITTNGLFTTLHSFAGIDGSGPYGALVQGADGNFYGTTEYAGSGGNNGGTVFRISSAGAFATLYIFTNGIDGGHSQAGLLQDSVGNFYGTTSYGGQYNYGTVFKISPSGVFAALYSFTGGLDGVYPEAALIQASDGNFYGTTWGGAGNGTVFKMTPSGALTTLYSLQGGNGGSAPVEPLVQVGYFLYGTTSSGGQGSSGTLFRLALPNPPSVVDQPLSVIASNHSTATFTVTPSGPGPFSYQWLFNGARISNNIITTFAGNGVYGLSGNGGYAPNAELRHPSSVVLDTNRNLIIADTYNGLIRKVGANGMITTVAGGGFLKANGTIATNAALLFPEGVTVDNVGNIFIADSLDNLVREVSTNGLIVTVAGGGYSYSSGIRATNTALGYPAAVAVDGLGDLFIADQNREKVDKVDTNGILTTVAGDGGTGFYGDGGPGTNAEFYNADGLAVDTHGNIFIVDTSNHRIRQLSTNGIISTVAGNGIPGYSGDGGQATNAELQFPYGVAVDTSGNLFIADGGNHVVREVRGNGIITTVAGNGVDGYSGDGGTATNAEISLPNDVAADAAGDLFIVDYNSNCVRRVGNTQGPTLIVGDVNSNNAGAYSVVISNAFGAVTSAVAILQLPQPITVLVNGEYSYSNAFVFPGTNTIEVTLRTSPPYTSIYYTLDGSAPDFTATLYMGAFEITNSVLLRTIAYNSDGTVSAGDTPISITVIPVYSLTNATPGGGQAILSPSPGPYLSNTVVSVAAVASNGWSFLGWAGLASGTNSATNIVVNGSGFVTAIFGTELSIANTTGGSIRLWPPQGPYAYSSTVTLMGVPAPGNLFNRWFDIFNGPSGNPYNMVVLTNNQAVSASFAPLPAGKFVLTTLVNGNGSVAASPAANDYASNAVVQVTATPNAGYSFIGWSGAASGSSNPLSVTMTKSKVITATFDPAPTIAITRPTNGAILTSVDALVTVTNMDSDSYVIRVDYYLNGASAASSSSAPFSSTLSNPNAGTFELTAVATDALGASSTSAPVVVEISLPVPVVSGFSPLVGPAGSTVTITGSNFNPIATNNIVTFGATRGQVIGGATNLLTVTVPTGATYLPLTVTTGGMTAFSRTPFLVTYPNDGSLSFDEQLILPTYPNQAQYLVADIDGDGKPDVLSFASGSESVSVFRNTSTPGVLNSNSFAPRVDIPIADATYIAVADIDGDGKPDLIAVTPVGSSGSNTVTIYRNISQPGTINTNVFAPGAVFLVGTDCKSIFVADFDGDGKPDILANSEPITVLRNTSAPGVIDANSFEAAQSPIGNLSAAFWNNSVAVADIDGDGRPDLIYSVYPGGVSGTVNVLLNNTVGTNISFGGPSASFANGDYPVGAIVGDLYADGIPSPLILDGNPEGVSNVDNESSPGSLSFAPEHSYSTALSFSLESVLPVIADLNGDGRPDIIIPGVEVMTNLGNHAFSSAIGLENAGRAVSVAVADLDGDGRPDIVCGSLDDSYLLVLRNTAGSPPSVTMTAPNSLTVFEAPTNILLTATASDPNPNGVVSQVVFYADEEFIGAAPNTPYSIFWTNAPLGVFSLHAVAMDSLGFSTTSSNVVIDVDDAPTVQVIFPTNGEQFVAPTNVILRASARSASPSFPIQSVAFYTNDAFLGSVSNVPGPSYQFVWTNPAPGNYSVFAQATDRLGLTADSQASPTTVTVVPAETAFWFASGTYSVSESQTFVDVVVDKSGGGGSVNYDTEDGSGAVAGFNYEPVSGQLDFSAAETSQTIAVPIYDNLLPQKTGMFSVILSPVDGGAVISPSSTTVTIIDTNTSLSYPYRGNFSQPPTNLASVTALLTPTNADGQWRLPDAAEPFWNDSGVVVSNLEPGNYNIDFLSRPEYSPFPLTIFEALTNPPATNIFTNGYTEVEAVPQGWLTVDLDPPQISALGAQWSLQGDPIWHTNGETINLPADSYIVEFASVPGYDTPFQRLVTVNSGVGAEIDAAYLLGGATSTNDLTEQPFSQLLSPTLSQGYGYNGQVRTPFSYGSGTVVTKRVVLTAAHVFYNETNGLVVGDVWWYFQRTKGVFESYPLRPDGVILFNGYAAARATNAAPTTLSQLDVAALYFTDPNPSPGRGGWSGYLASDSPTNEWLVTGGSEKFIAGYPMSSPILPNHQGRLFTSAVDHSPVFSLMTNEVFTTSEFTGLPGMSGGALYVQDGALFYPAAVYLGGNSQSSIVRAIDSSVIALIDDADRASLGDTNHYSAGDLLITLNGNSVANTAIKIILGPPSALSQGAGWESTNLGVTAFTTTVFPQAVTTSNVLIVFKTIPGYNPPSITNVPINSGQTTVIQANYSAKQPDLTFNVTNNASGLGTIVLNASGTAAKSKFILEATTDLNDGAWIFVNTNTFTNGSGTLPPISITNRSKFFRLQWVPD